MNNSLLCLRILIVDDVLEHAKRLERKICHLDHEVVICQTGEEALSLMTEDPHTYNPFDVAILDYLMPGMSGIELGEQLKEIDSLMEVIILTSDSSQEASRDILLSSLEPRCLIRKKEDISVMESALNYVLTNKELIIEGTDSKIKERHQALYKVKKKLREKR